MTEQDRRSEAEPEKSNDEDVTTSQPLPSHRADHLTARTRYAYLFHLWTEPRRADTKPLWRFSLEEVESGVRHGFGSFDALVEFLQQRMATE